MNRIVVTGAAGFIGSHLCEELLKDESNQVIGIDAFMDFTTPTWIRQKNVSTLLQHPRFEWVNADLLTFPWAELLARVDIIYHLAGMPGVRSSWGPDFVKYVDHNIVATQRMLEACKGYPLKRFIFASTSSVYGEQTGRVDEHASLLPLSPYGISKLACEHLCRVYGDEGIPMVILRFFTVFGPRQRPDMAFHRFIKQMLDNQPITLYGDGYQTRDFTYVLDCVKAVSAVAHANGVVGETINIGGKDRASIHDSIALLEQLMDQKAQIKVSGSTFGEPRNTWADISKAESLLGYTPSVDLKAGLAMEVQYVRDLYQL